MFQLLLNLKALGWKRAGMITGAVAVVFLAAHDYLQGVALRGAELAYKNPRTVEVVRTVKVAGPVRVVTRVVEIPGRKETTTEEVRGPVTEATGTESIREPVFAPARPPRWVAGASLLDFRPGDRTGWTAWGGVSLGGRLDLCLGVTGGFRPAAMALWRF